MNKPINYKAEYEKLLDENHLLREEIESLKSQIQNPNANESSDTAKVATKTSFFQDVTVTSGVINKFSSPKEKIDFYFSLFKGRTDVYAKRWENKKKDKAGYSPVCTNEWVYGLCNKPKVKCSKCLNRDYEPLDESVIESHLKGQIVAGVYPLLTDETCHFLAIDFDGEEWKDDIVTIREICNEFEIPMVLERSRSGNGAHLWFFFENAISAGLVRKFGSSLLTYGMGKRYKIAFSSYDRLFPNQDTMPKGGLGNLIALPLQMGARKNGNAVFIDDSLKPYNDQWAFLSSIKRFTKTEIEVLTGKLSDGNELGMLKVEEDEIRPWEKQAVVKLKKNDFPLSTSIIRANMLYIPTTGISQPALNQIKRLAAFKNPEFYKAQAMRLPTFNKPRVISCSEIKAGYLCLPRGCETEMIEIFSQSGTEISFLDKTNSGVPIDIDFKGVLRDEQQLAFDKMLSANYGILSGTTAFGKTVVALKLIAERKVNTLILVDKINLLSQWESRINEFLSINETIKTKRGRESKKSVIGKLGGGKQQLKGIIDIALLQSLNRQGEVRECVKDYGMVIVDECHHVSAFTFESVLKEVNAKYVYGLTATPTRKDGHHPIITMQCGDILYRDDAKAQAAKRPFEHYLMPRFTPFKLPENTDKREITISNLYSEIVEDETRNQLIVEDVETCYREGKNCMVLTGRKIHVEKLIELLKNEIPDIVALTGGMGTKTTRLNLNKISEMPEEKPLVIVATGSFIGEGFDAPRLDTLFLAMPISWKGTLQQYAGRLHRLYDTKKEVVVYDYIDIHVPMLERMYSRRLKGYASIGYKLKNEMGGMSQSSDFIYDTNSFLPVFARDIRNVNKEILIVSPFITQKRTHEMLSLLSDFIHYAKVTIITRPGSDFENNRGGLKRIHDEIRGAGINLILKSNFHQKFAIIDHKYVWYGSINLMSFGKAQESMMRIVSGNIAYELERGIRNLEG
ncbi:MAG: DEAD/DEAH box helicase family protein [Prolixibacteraceae bacterium]|nr:DEAD/DEAH box helicase family protein [Prolixibacteraceae bacterium]